VYSIFDYKFGSNGGDSTMILASTIHHRTENKRKQQSKMQRCIRKKEQTIIDKIIKGEDEQRQC
jgi:hypothetical protein